MKLSISSRDTAFIFSIDNRSQLVAMIDNGEEIVIKFNSDILTITATETGLHVNDKGKNAHF